MDTEFKQINPANQSEYSGVETTIRAPKGIPNLNLIEIWHYRYMIYFLIVRNLRVQYQQSVLGPAWILINAFVNTIVYSFIFGAVAQLPSEGVPYPVFVYSSLLCWTFFSASISGITGSIEKDSTLQKVYYPRLITPMVTIANNLVQLLISLILFFPLLAIYGLSLNINIIFFPYFVLHSMILSLGVGLILAPLQVRTRDVSQLVAYLIRFWFYATPVVYSLEALPEALTGISAFNPMTPVIQGARWSLLGGEATLDLPALLASLLLSCVIMIAGAYFFKQQEQYFADLS